MRKIIIALTAGTVMTLAACGSSSSGSASSTTGSTQSASSVATSTPGSADGGKAFSTPQGLAAALDCTQPGTQNVYYASNAVQCNLGGPSGATTIIATFANSGDENNWLSADENGGSWGNGDGCAVLGPDWAVAPVESAGSGPCEWAKNRVGGTEYSPS